MLTSYGVIYGKDQDLYSAITVQQEQNITEECEEEMTEDELSSLDRFFDDPDGTKSDMESKPSVDEVENG